MNRDSMSLALLHTVPSPGQPGEDFSPGQQGQATLTEQWPAGVSVHAPRLDRERLLMTSSGAGQRALCTTACNADARLKHLSGALLSAPPSAGETGPLQVLLVEDNSTDVLFIQEMLTASQAVMFQVTHVAYLSEAVRQLATQRFDVVLLDLSLPDSLGLATFTRLHAQAQAVPVVVLTGLNDATLAVDAVKAGAQDYLVKGQVDGPQLVRAICYAIERQRAEEALRRQQDWLRVTLSSIDDAVIATDPQGTITFMNAIAASLTGWPGQTALGRHITEVFRILNDCTRESIESPVARVLRERTVVALADHTVLLARDGREIPIADSGAPIHSADGTLQGVVLVFRDISERRRLEEQLRQAQKMQAIGALAGGIAHDFNNILAAMLGYTELAASDAPLASPVHRYLHEVLTAGQRARDLVRQILAFSRRTGVARSPVQLHLLVKEALSLLRASLPATIEVRHQLDEGAGAVLTEPVQMHQVLMNLCANAEYAMRQTGGVLELSLEAVEVDTTHVGATLPLSPGPYVRLTVRDTGPGMAPDVRRRIFEPFFTTKGPGEGTGMGLSVVHGIVTSHGGTITVASAPGQGATFAVYLPRCAAAMAESATPIAEPLPKGQGRVLLVDDEAVVAHVGQEQLARLNYDVVVCLSGGEALEVFRAAPQRFDLVITDQTMPQMTGDALARALRCIRPDIPIILCTGFSHTIDPGRARQLGIDAWLAKPWQAHELARTIQEVFALRRSPHA